MLSSWSREPGSMCGDCRNHRARLPACLPDWLLDCLARSLACLLARSLARSLARLTVSDIGSPAYLRQCAASARRTCCCIALRYTVAAANVSPIYLPATTYAVGFLFPTSSSHLFASLLPDGESSFSHFHGYPRLLRRIPFGSLNVTGNSDFVQLQFGKSSLPIAISNFSFFDVE